MATQRLRGNSFGDMAAQLQGQRVAPTASPMQSMTESLRSPSPTIPKTPGTGLSLTGDAGRSGYKPNFTMGGSGAPPASASSLPAVSNRPNFTMGGNSATAAPEAVTRPISANPAGAPTSPRAERFGRVAGRSARLLGPAAAGGAAISSLADQQYRINDPGTDSSAMGTVNALRSGDISGAGRSLSKGLLETGMDLGGMAAGALDLVSGDRATPAYQSTLRRQFGDQLSIGGQGPAAAPAAPGAVPAAKPNGVSLPSTGAGSGRGSPADPNRTDVDPTDPRFGAARDFSKDLASVPRDLPADMRDGVVLKTKDANGRTVYSGRNVGADAQMVDGMGKTLRSGGGTVSTVPGMAPGEAQAILARPSPGAEGAGSGTNFGGSGGLVASGGLFDTPKARRAAQELNLNEQNMRLDNAATLRGQDVTERGNKLTFDANMAGVAQRDAAARMPYAAQAAARARTAQYLRGPRGANIDPAAGAKAAAAAGDTDAAKALSEMAASQDALASGRDKGLRTAVAADSQVMDKDGNPQISEALQASNARIIQQLASARNISVEELMADAPTMGAVLKLSKDMNSKRETGLLQQVGFDAPDPTLSGLGELRGQQMGAVGWFDALLSPQLKMGDKKITTGDRNRYLSRDTVSDAEVQKLLKELGIK